MKLIIILLMMTCLGGCLELKVKRTQLAEHMTASGRKVVVDFVQGGATGSDGISIDFKDNETPYPIENLNYNYLKYSELLGDTSIKLVVGNKGYKDELPNKFDTVTISLSSSTIK